MLPLAIAGEKPDAAWLEELLDQVGLADRRCAPPVRALRRPAAARRDRPRARLAPDGAVRRRADRQPRLDARAAEILELLRARGRRLRPDDVMVTHDAHAAAIADRILFLADGAIVRELGPSQPRRGPRRAGGGEPRDDRGSRSRASRRASSAPCSPRSRSSSASRWSAAPSSSPTRSRRRSTTSSPSRTRTPTRSSPARRSSTTHSAATPTVPGAPARAGARAARRRRRPRAHRRHRAATRRRQAHRPATGRSSTRGGSADLRLRHRPASRRFNPLQLDDGQLGARAGRGRDRQRHGRQTHFAVGDTVGVAATRPGRSRSRSSASRSSATSTRSAARRSPSSTSRPPRRCFGKQGQLRRDLGRGEAGRVAAASSWPRPASRCCRRPRRCRPATSRRRRTSKDVARSSTFIRYFLLGVRRRSRCSSARS